MYERILGQRNRKGLRREMGIVVEEEGRVRWEWGLMRGFIVRVLPFDRMTAPFIKHHS